MRDDVHAPFLEFRDLALRLADDDLDHEREISRHLAADFLGEESHAVTFAAALRLPEHAEIDA